MECMSVELHVIIGQEPEFFKGVVLADFRQVAPTIRAADNLTVYTIAEYRVTLLKLFVKVSIHCSYHPELQTFYQILNGQCGVQPRVALIPLMDAFLPGKIVEFSTTIKSAIPGADRHISVGIIQRRDSRISKHIGKKAKISPGGCPGLID